MRYISFMIAFVIILFFHHSQAQTNEESSVAIHGFISQGYMQSTDNNLFGDTENGTFKFNEFGLNISSQVTENLHIGMQLFSRNLGYLGGSKIIVDWAYGDYRWQDWLGIRAGKIKMPLGFYNEIRDVDMLRTSIFLPQSVYNETWRTTINAIQGIGLYGSTPSSILGTLNYQVQVGVYNIDMSSSMSKLIQERLYATMYNFDVSTSYVGSLIWETPLDGLRLGISGYFTELSSTGKTHDSDYWRNITRYSYWLSKDKQIPFPSYEEASQYIDFVNMNIKQSFNNFTTFWLSGEYTIKGLTLAAEYLKQQGTVVTYGKIKSSNQASDDFKKLNETDAALGGFYGSIDYQFTNRLSICAYYSEYYPELGDKDGKKLEKETDLPAYRRWSKDFSLSMKFNINSNWIAKIEGHHIDGIANLYLGDQSDISDMTRWWYLFAAKLTYNF